MTETKQHNNVLAVKLPMEARHVIYGSNPIDERGLIFFIGQDGFFEKLPPGNWELLGEAYSLRVIESNLSRVIDRESSKGKLDWYASIIDDLGIKEGENWYILIDKG